VRARACVRACVYVYLYIHTYILQPMRHLSNELPLLNANFNQLLDLLASSGAYACACACVRAPARAGILCDEIAMNIREILDRHHHPHFLEVMAGQTAAWS